MGPVPRGLVFCCLGSSPQQKTLRQRFGREGFTEAAGEGPAVGQLRERAGKQVGSEMGGKEEKTDNTRILMSSGGKKSNEFQTVKYDTGCRNRGLSELG